MVLGSGARISGHKKRTAHFFVEWAVNYYSFIKLLYIARTLLSIAFPGEGFLGATLFTGLQIKRMALDLFYNIFLLDLAFEAAKRTLKGFTVLKNYLCQAKITTFRLGYGLGSAESLPL